MDVVAEPGLVRDVISACQGISSATVAVSTDTGGDLTFNVAKHLSRPQRQLVLRLCEYGWLFRRAQASARQAQGSKDAAGGAGAVAQAFRCAIQSRLAEQFQMFALLEKQLQHPLPTGSSGKDAQQPYLTLLRLVLWLDQPTLLLRWVCLFADAVADSEGGQLLRMLYAQSRHGNPFVASLAESFLEEAAVPFLETLRVWLAVGRLSASSACDFFITERPGEWSWSQQPREQGGCRTVRPNAWQERYVANPEQLPHLISEDLAALILRTGKSIAFLREGCGDHEFEAGSAISALWPREPITLLQGDTLEAVVRAEVARVDKYLLVAVMGRAAALSHAHAIRSFLLASAGDFVWALVDALEPLFDRLASETSAYAMNTELEAAIRGSSARLESDDVLGRLHIQLSPGGSLESAWDVFALEYDLTEPLATVFTPAAATVCGRVSRLVWALARSTRQLAGAWSALSRAQRHISAVAAMQRRLGMEGKPPLTDARSALSELHRGRATAASFFATLQEHVHREVIDSAWTDFEIQSAAAGNLDDVIAAHMAYLEGIQQRLLLAPPAEPLVRNDDEDTQAALKRACATATLLAGHAAQLEGEASAATQSLAALERLAGRRRKAGEWAVLPTDTCVGMEAETCQEIQQATAEAAAAFEDARVIVTAAFNRQCRSEGRGPVFI